MKIKLSNKTKAAMAEQTIAHALRGIQEAIDPDSMLRGIQEAIDPDSMLRGIQEAIDPDAYLPAADRETALPKDHVLAQYGGGGMKKAGRLFVLRKGR